MIFTTPSREVLERQCGPGLGISAQAHALGRRILHVTLLAQRDPRLHEVHPVPTVACHDDLLTAPFGYILCVEDV
jgi:hypothetical protein